MPVLRSARPRRAAQGRFIGIGIGNYVEGTGLGPVSKASRSGCMPSGKVAVATGATNQGQGTRTTLSQIVADRLGCRMEDIVMTVGDTAAISQGVGAFASRQAVNAGSSAHDGGRRRSQVRSSKLAAAGARMSPKPTSIVEDGVAIARTRQPAVADIRRTGADGAGHAGLLAGAGPDAGP